MPKVDSERRRAAYHEAGHAVVGIMQGLRLTQLCISPGPDPAEFCPGITRFNEGARSSRRLAPLVAPRSGSIKPVFAARLLRRLGPEAMRICAGEAAEAKYSGRRPDPSKLRNELEFRRAPVAVAIVICKMLELGLFLPEAERLLSRPAVWVAVEHIATRLERELSLDPCEVQRYVEAQCLKKHSSRRATSAVAR